jgi:hypothetical protein
MYVAPPCMAVAVMTGDSSGALSPRLAATPFVIPASQGFALPGTGTVSAKAAFARNANPIITVNLVFIRLIGLTGLWQKCSGAVARVSIHEIDFAFSLITVSSQGFVIDFHDELPMLG